MLRREREGIRFGRKVYSPAHRSAPRLGRVGRLRPSGEGIEDCVGSRPNCASPKFAFDIFGPRRPTRPRLPRKDHASRLEERDRHPEAATSPWVTAALRLHWQFPGHVLLQLAPIRRFPCGLRSLRPRTPLDVVAHRVDIAADIICCDAHGPGLWAIPGIVGERPPA